MEEKLAEYRARKAKEHAKYRSDTSWKGNILGYIGLRNRDQNTQQNPSSTPSKITLDGNETSAQESIDKKSLDGQDHFSQLRNPSNDNEAIPMPLTRQEKLYNLALLVLKIVLWMILWALFVEIGFGAVFFIVSSFIIIYRTMRSGSRDRSKLSAYSVFNPNFERLEGTFTAEQFEKELRYGAGSIR